MTQLNHLLKISLAILVMTVGVSMNAQMITNGNFETGEILPWQIWAGGGASGTAVADNANVLNGQYSASVTLDAAGTGASWELAFAQAVNGSFDTTHSYQIIFRIQGNAAFDVDCLLQGTDNPWPTLYGNTVNVTTTSQLVTQTFTVSENANANFLFRVGAIGAGNNVWIDDVEIVDLTTNSVMDLSSFENVTIYPNPANNFTNVSFNTKNIEILNIYIIDLTGKIILQRRNINCISGMNTYQMNLKDIHSGIYFVKIESDNISKSFKLIKK